MSVQAMAWVFDHSQSEGNARLVLLSVANHADREGDRAWPKAETIARESRCDRATVFRALNRLKELGELDWLSGGGTEGGRRKSNYYWLPLMRLGLGLSTSPLTTSQIATVSQRQGRTDDPTRSHPGADKVAPMRLEPSLTVQNHDSFYEQTPNPKSAAKVRAILDAFETK